MEVFMNEVFSVFKMIDIQDIIDIAIVAFVLYQLAKLIRETRAAQLIKGILILFIALQLSSWFNFYTLNYLLENTVQIGAVALLIVFQPELRRALERVGTSKVSTIFNPDAMGETPSVIIDNICSAVESLAENNIGALIVLERETKIGEIINTGTTIDAIVSAELLVNIFIPNTPLHDGAVVIRQGKLAAAACFLPLTQNQNLSKELGTRHRAAIGISETCDAVVVVVSEETGKISLASNGDMTRNLTVGNLNFALTKSMGKKTEGKEKKILFWNLKK